MNTKNLFKNNDKLTSLHFWSEEKSIHVITNSVKDAITQMQKIYKGINCAIATGQPNRPEDNQIQLKY